MTVTTTTTTTTTTTLSTDDLPFDVVLDHEPESYMDPVVHKNDDGTYTVVYATHDPYHGLDAEWVLGEGATFEEFRTEWDRDEFIESQDPEDHVFIVNHYEHGTSVYTVASSPRQVPDYGGFDTRPSCVLVLHKEAGFTNPREAADSLMAEFTSWTQGEVYVLHRETFDAAGERLEEDTCGGFIGTEYVEERLRTNDW